MAQVVARDPVPAEDQVVTWSMSIGDTDISSRNVSPNARWSSTRAARPTVPPAAAVETDVGAGCPEG